MKRQYLMAIYVLILIALLSAACGSSSGAADQAATSDPSAATGSELLTEGTGFCANDFFPLRSDKTWQYSIISGETTSTYSTTYKDITDISFTSIQTFPDLTNEVNWQCSADGMLSSNYANMTMASTTDVKFDTIEVTGIALPPANQWEIGKVWDMSYKVQVKINNSGSEIQADGEIAISSEVAAIETITVPAGSYENAYRVDSTGVFTITLMGNQTSTPLIYSDWYVKGVGLVKSSSSDANLPYNMELISFE